MQLASEIHIPFSLLLARSSIGLLDGAIGKLGYLLDQEEQDKVRETLVSLRDALRVLTDETEKKAKEACAVSGVVSKEG